MQNSETNARSTPVSIIGVLLLIIIVMVAVYFRFVGLNWDENQHLHPDERFLTMVETGIQPIGAPIENIGEARQRAQPDLRVRLEACPDWGGYFDTACSPLNPANRGYGYYVYGTLPLFLVRYVGQAIGQTGYDQIHLLGRMLSALADIITLLLLFAIARRLYGEKVALLAAALFAAAVLPIQQSHFFTVDNFTVLFVTATLFFTVRAQQHGRWYDFAGAGLMLGAAASCKISVWPLAGIVTLAAALWWRGGPRRLPEAALFKLTLAGLLAVLAFRIFQPYAFSGPNFWNISLDPGWRETMNSIQKLASGDQDVPFGHQWTDRAPIIFPWVNMVVWGLGLPLGLAAWVGWALVAWQIARKTPTLPSPASGGGFGCGWRTHLLLWLWASGFFIYQGSQWVKSIRYILPVYPFFIIFAAYGLINFKLPGLPSRAGKIPNLKFSRQSPIPNTQHPTPNTRPHYATAILTAIVLIGALAWAWGFTRIYTRPVTRVQASRWIYENVPTAATLRYQSESGEQVLQLSTPPETTYNQGVPIAFMFQVPERATLTSITMSHLTDLAMDLEAETIRLTISQDPVGQSALAQAEITVHLEQAPPSGGNYLFQFPPIELWPNQQYYLVGQDVDSGPIMARSSTMGNEHWDDGIPVRVDGRDGFSNYRGVELQNYAEDESSKLIAMVNWLSQTDYINLTSNRLYGSIPRLPTRFPMTTEFYRALFSGELGFEKAAEFTSYTTLGPLEFPDQESAELLGIPNPFDHSSGRIPIFLPPAEEAFSVYDHPRVVIYRKTPDFSAEKVMQILSQPDLEQVIRLWPKQATAAPTALTIEPEVWDKQQQSGTWSQLYDRASLLNRSPLAAIVAWWLALALLGALAWPIIAYAWPALPDRGWGLARALGLLVVGYLSWLAASLRVLTFGRGTLIAAMCVLAALSAMCVLTAHRKRINYVSRITYYVKEHWRLLLIEEAVFAFTFGIFLLIRYGNGDLWHFYLGGERPMDFAYLNAVLKSVYFPPYDPWYAGGQMNYYYFGFVLVSAPIKLLGIVPALAYNLALPMLAALTAAGAFSVAFNLSQIPNLKFKISNFTPPSPAPNSPSPTPNLQSGICVGLLAALFVVFMGNLGEIKVIFDALAQLGQSSFRTTIPGLAYTVSWIRGMLALLSGQQLPVNLDWWYWNPSRIMANGEINEFPFFTFLYSDLHAHMIAFPLTVLMLGIGLGWALRRKWNSVDAAISILVGALVVGAARANNTWDYPTYLVIAFLGLFASGLQTASSLQPKRQARSTYGALLSGGLGLALFAAAWAMGGINNIPTFTMLAMLLFVSGQLAHRLLEKQACEGSEPWQASSPWRWIDAAYIALVGLSILCFYPYVKQYATAYSSIELWKGARSPVNAYILIQGILLFPLATFLIAQLHRLGWRWFAAAIKVSRIWREAILVFALILAITVLAIAWLGYSVIVIVGPLMILAALLLVRPRQPVAQRYALLLTPVAVAITFAVEVIVLRGDIGRMNTVFKFYLQAWIILGIVGAAMLGWLGRLARRWRPDTWFGWRVAMAALIFSGLMYTFFATRAKLNDRFDPSLGPTLDAMQFMTVAHANEQGQDYAFADEYAALIWMQDNIQGTPVVAESAAAPEYRSLRNRVTTYTGLPALVGYNWHQRQQRSILPGEVIDWRVADTNELYSTPDATQAMRVIRRYNIRYIMAGYPEILYYPPTGLAKFDQMVTAGQLRVAYQNNSVTIYEVVK